MEFLKLCLLLTTAAIAAAEICRDAVCEYRFEVHRSQSMTYRAPNGRRYNVAFNGTRLQIIENSFRKAESDALIGTFVNASDVTALDGFTRDHIVVNGGFPGPTIEVMEGAQIVVHAFNNLATDAIAIHWHGMHQVNTPFMDGIAFISQCPILPTHSFTYRFKASPVGTHWWHNHLSNTHQDGFSGMLIIHRELPATPEFHIDIQDWYHASGPSIHVHDPFGPGGSGDGFMAGSDRDRAIDGSSVSNLGFVSGLINGRGRWNDLPAPLTVFPVSSGVTYRFRVACSGSERGFVISVDGHELRVVALDGIEVAPLLVDSVTVFPGETLDFEMDASKSGGLYWMRAVTLRSGRGPSVEQDGEIHGVHAIVRYGDVVGDIEPTSSPRDCTSGYPCRVFNCPFTGYPDSDNKICLMVSDAHIDVANEDFRATYGLDDEPEQVHFLNWHFGVGPSVNAHGFVKPKIPLYQDYEDYIVPCNHTACEAGGCRCTNILDLPYDKTIQMIFANYNPRIPTLLAHHPIHMHGHNFAVLAMGYPTYNHTTGRHLSDNEDIECNTLLCSKPAWREGREPTLNLVDPPVRDVLIIPAGGYAVIRFRTDNPGFWFMHCHLQLHMMSGMAMVLGEAVERIARLPRNFPTCNMFDWTSEEYEYYMRAPTTTVTTTPSTGSTTTPSGLTQGGGKEITCITFNETVISGTHGDWVSNTGVLVETSNCVSGSCAYFPGDDSRLEVPRFQAAFDAWSQFSLSFWMRNMEDGPSGIITNGGCSHSPGELPSLYVHGDWSGKLTVGMTNKIGLAKFVTVNTGLLEWSHVAVTWDGQTMIVYVDGDHAGTAALHGSRLASPNCPLIFGESANPDLRPFQGYLDQVCTYEKALTAAEVTLLHATPSLTHLPTA